LVSGRGRVDLPYQPNGQSVNLAEHVGGNALIVSGVLVHPIGGSRVTLDFERLDDVAVRSTSVDEVLDLSPSHRVSLDRGRVVNVVDPDLAEDLVSLNGTRKTPEVLMQQGDVLIET
jgi:hypothetical protein